MKSLEKQLEFGFMKEQRKAERLDNFVEVSCYTTMAVVTVLGIIGYAVAVTYFPYAP